MTILGKSYLTLDEYNSRKEIFEQSVRDANHHNMFGKGSFTMGLNWYSDIDFDEYLKILGVNGEER
jgi:hypothetical protein